MVTEEHLERREVIVTYPRAETDHPGSHETLTRIEVAKKLAALKGCEFAGEYDQSHHYPGRVYFVPSDTVGVETAQELGIHSEHDLFGGVVPYPFVATKSIT